MKKVLMACIALCCLVSVAEARPRLLRRLAGRVTHKHCQGNSCTIKVSVGHIKAEPILPVYEAPTAVYDAPVAAPGAYAR